MNQPLADTVTPRTVKSKGQTDVPVVALMPQAPNPIHNRGGEILNAGQSQTLMEANDGRFGMWIQNQSANGESLFINELGEPASPDNGSIELAMGSIWEAPFGGLSTAKISIYGATAGQKFAAREW